MTAATVVLMMDSFSPRTTSYISDPRRHKTEQSAPGLV
jgi:hypothetical protein